MTDTLNDARDQGSLQRLEQSAENWQAEIDDYEQRVQALTGKARSELGRAVGELKNRWHEVRQRVDDLQASGEEQVDSAREWARTRYRELASLGQRVSEQVLVDADGTSRARYLLGPAPGGGWDLKRAGAAHPIRHFDDKRSALAYSSRYARQHEPSVLVVRRQDGTFQQNRSYGRIERD